MSMLNSSSIFYTNVSQSREPPKASVSWAQQNTHVFSAHIMSLLNLGMYELKLSFCELRHRWVIYIKVAEDGYYLSEVSKEAHKHIKASCYNGKRHHHQCLQQNPWYKAKPPTRSSSDPIKTYSCTTASFIWGPLAWRRGGGECAKAGLPRWF